MSVTVEPSAQAKKVSDAVNLADFSSVESFMQKVFQRDKSDRMHLVDDVHDQIDTWGFDKTSNLIEEASHAIEALSERCEILKLELEQEKVSSLDLAEQVSVLKSVIREFQAKNSSCESEVKAVTLRCQTAEARIVVLEQNVKSVTLRASRAEGLSSRLQHQVEAAFGQGSPVRSIMDAPKLPQAAE